MPMQPKKGNIECERRGGGWDEFIIILFNPARQRREKLGDGGQYQEEQSRKEQGEEARKKEDEGTLSTKTTGGLKRIARGRNAGNEQAQEEGPEKSGRSTHVKNGGKNPD